MNRRALGLAVLVLVLATAGGLWRWTRTADSPVTEAEARGYLDRIVTAALAGDLQAVCSLNGARANCERTLDGANLRASVPSERPSVTGTRYVPAQDGSVAGRVLIVEGRNRCGRPYRTEVFIFREDRDHLKAINAVYWSNFTLGTGPEVSPPPTPPPAPCP